MRTQNNTNFLYKQLSYELQGCFFEIRKEYGPGQKESIYVNLLLECLKTKKYFSREGKSYKYLFF
jgi:predicted metal-dependent hydrolase